MLNVSSLTGKFYFLLLGIVVPFFVMSCSDVQKHEPPENLISREKMIDIFTDMIILDALDRNSPRTLKSYNLKTSGHILKKFDLDSLTLAQNIEYYNLEFETNQDIYNEVSSRIEAKKDKIDSIVKVRDSLQAEKRRIQAEKTKDSLSPIKSMIKQQIN